MRAPYVVMRVIWVVIYSVCFNIKFKIRCFIQVKELCIINAHCHGYTSLNGAACHHHFCVVFVWFLKFLHYFSTVIVWRENCTLVFHLGQTHVTMLTKKLKDIFTFVHMVLSGLIDIKWGLIVRESRLPLLTTRFTTVKSVIKYYRLFISNERYNNN